MAYLKITSIEKIDTNTDLFIHSDANGVMLAIKQIHLYSSDGTEQRICRMTKELIEKIKLAKIEI